MFLCNQESILCIREKRYSISDECVYQAVSVCRAKFTKNSEQSLILKRIKTKEKYIEICRQIYFSQGTNDNNQKFTKI